MYMQHVMEIFDKDMANDNEQNFCLLTLQKITIKCFFQLKDIQYTGPVFFTLQNVFHNMQSNLLFTNSKFC